MAKTEDINNDDNKDDVGLGVDIVSIERMKKIIHDTDNFIDFTFTKNEIDYCKNTPRWVEHFATHFAAKEAVLKALGEGFLADSNPKDVEVLHDSKGKPYIEVHGPIKDIVKSREIKEIPVSLSFTNNDAVAVAIVLTDANSLQKSVLTKAKDPVSELTKQFKEAKKLLEEQDFNKSNNENE